MQSSSPWLESHNLSRLWKQAFRPSACRDQPTQTSLDRQLELLLVTMFHSLRSCPDLTWPHRSFLSLLSPICSPQQHLSEFFDEERVIFRHDTRPTVCDVFVSLPSRYPACESRLLVCRVLAPREARSKYREPLCQLPRKAVLDMFCRAACFMFLSFLSTDLSAIDPHWFSTFLSEKLWRRSLLVRRRVQRRLQLHPPPRLKRSMVLPISRCDRALH